MPLYFFDFGGNTDEWEGVDLPDDENARLQALIAVSKIQTGGRNELIGRQTHITCSVRNSAGEIIGTFSAPGLLGDQGGVAGVGDRRS